MGDGSGPFVWEIIDMQLPGSNTRFPHSVRKLKTYNIICCGPQSEQLRPPPTLQKSLSLAAWSSLFFFFGQKRHGPGHAISRRSVGSVQRSSLHIENPNTIFRFSVSVSVVSVSVLAFGGLNIEMGTAPAAWSGGWQGFAGNLFNKLILNVRH